MAPRVLFFGAGSVGGGYTYVLSRKLPAKNIVAICRSNFEAASNNGFRMDSTKWGQNLHWRPTIVRSVEEAVAVDNSKPFDYLVVSSKVLPASPSIAESISPAISENTSIVLLQNGIAIEEAYAELYPNNPILSAVVYFAATQISPAVIEHSEIESLHVGTYPAKAPTGHKKAAESFADLITGCGATAKLHDDVQPQRWVKLMLNASLNPICALSRSRDTQFLHSTEDSEHFMRDTMAEIVSVAQAHGYKNLNEGSIDHDMGRVKTRRPPGVKPSMMADALAGRNMEVDAIVGNLIKLAREKNLNVPILRTLYVLLKALNDSFSRDREHTRK